jgi:hypothetical protein
VVRSFMHVCMPAAACDEAALLGLLLC